MSRERILIIEDERLIRWSLREKLEAEGYEVSEAESGGAGLKHLEDNGAELILLDLRLPDVSGIEVLRKISRDHADTAVIMMTAYSTVDTAVEAMRLGASDYVNKPFKTDEMVVKVGKALETTRLKREVKSWRESSRPAPIVGESAKIKEVNRLIDKIAASRASTILIEGESGTGKDLVAKHIHHRSDRVSGAFMNITCSAVPETLLESELMGHEKGAFTDAKAQKKGLFEMADGGTLFLDEIGDMGISLQAKVLRFLEDKSFKRVGGTRDLRVDVRIVAATNRKLEEAVREGRFREDLYYRLKVIPIYLPSLRERKEDIPLLLKHFLDLYNTEFKKNTRDFTREAKVLLSAYPWPGNVRELRNVVERVMILESKEWIDVEDLPPEIRQASSVAGAPRNGFRLPPEGVDIEEVEKSLIRQALDLTGGNQVRAARLLNLSRDALRYRMKKFGYL